jgi:putative Ca2+/H+ antiporter (TMEM165/GDT1 family)
MHLFEPIMKSALLCASLLVHVATAEQRQKLRTGLNLKDGDSPLVRGSRFASLASHIVPQLPQGWEPMPDKSEDGSAKTSVVNTRGIVFNTEKSMIEGFYSSFAMILATEIGDETFIIAAVMSMRHPKLAVLSGALSALYFMTVLSAALGIVLPNLISASTVRSCATILYIFFGLRLIWIGAQHEEENKDEEFEEVKKELEGADERAQNSLFRRICHYFCSAVFLEALILTFLAEWGDRSQIATITLASHQNPLGVIIGACIGHTLCTGFAVFAGEWLGKRISQRFVAFGGGCLFMVFAVLNQFPHFTLNAEGLSTLFSRTEVTLR